MSCRLFIAHLILLMSCDELTVPLDIVVEDAGQLCNGILDGGVCIETETTVDEYLEHEEPESEKDRKKTCEFRKKMLEECIEIFGKGHEECIEAKIRLDECIISLADSDGAKSLASSSTSSENH